MQVSSACVELRLRGRQRLQHAQRMRRRSHRLLWSCDGRHSRRVRAAAGRAAATNGPCGVHRLRADFAEPAATHAAASVAAARAAGSAVAATSAISRAFRQLREYWLFMLSRTGRERSGSKSTLRRGPQLHAIHDWGCDGTN